MRALLVLALVLVAPTAAAEQRVEVRPEGASPSTVLASDWETIRWAWPANESHALVDAATGEPWCDAQAPGCLRFFPAAGTYSYRCALHPGLEGRVVVERGAGGDPASPLHAFFVVQPEGLSATFDASAAAQSRTAIESFEWDFGDGSSGFGRVVRHDYERPGVYVVRLTITDEFGDSDTNGRRVELQAPGDPEAFFWTNATDRVVLFEAPTNDSAVHHWDFGDGTSAFCPGPSCEALGPETVAASSTSLVHIYRRAGDFVVEHNVSFGPELATRSASWVMRVRSPESFDVVPDGLAVRVDASALGTYGNASYEWLFGDIERASGPNASHTFPQPGLWSIELTLRDAAGSLTLEREVLVLDAPEAPMERLVAAALEDAPEATPRATPFPLALAFLALLVALFARPERYK